MKVQNQTAVVSRKNKISPNIRHITTFGINDSRVTGIIRLDQGDRIHVDYSQFSRLSPLVAPTFGNFKVQTHAFWVPLRLIWRHYGEYINNTADISFTNIKQPINFSLRDIVEYLFFSQSASQFVEFVGQNQSYISDVFDKCDIRLVNFDSNDTPFLTGWNFTDYGRLVWNNLMALGYALPTYIVRANNQAIDYSALDLDGAYGFYNSEDYSIYPILAMSRCFYDWIYPSQYVSQQGYGYLFTDSLYSQWRTSRRQVFVDMLDLISTCYDRNFWTSLWSQPNAVSLGSNSGIGSSINVFGTPPNSDPSAPTYIVGANNLDNSVYRVTQGATGEQNQNDS